MKKLLKISCLIISILLIASLTAGCSGPASQGSPKTPTTEPGTAQTGTEQSNETGEIGKYPVKTDVTLTYWSILNANVSSNYKSLADTPFAKELEKETGIKVEYLHPSSSANEAFNLMIASEDLPDIIEYWWLDFPGGPEQAIQNNIILRANDYIDKYAPNLKKFLQEHPEVDKMVKTDNGSYYGFPMIRGDELLLTFQGLAIRNDWLQEVGLEKPETIDEWYVVLEAYRKVFKNPMVLQGYINTFLVVVVGLMFNLTLTSLGAYFLSRKNLMLKKTIMFLITFTMFFSGGLIPFYLTVKELKIDNTLWALIIPSAINTFYLLVMRTSFQNIPDSLEESAKLDGAGHFTILVQIVLPLSLPTIAVMILYYGVQHWNAWFHAAIFLRQREKFPLQLVLRDILIDNKTEEMALGVDTADRESVSQTIKYAIIIVATVPILTLYPFLQKYFVKGALLGAIKG